MHAGPHFSRKSKLGFVKCGYQLLPARNVHINLLRFANCATPDPFLRPAFEERVNGPNLRIEMPENKIDEIPNAEGGCYRPPAMWPDYM